MLGVPGLIEAIRAGNVAVANMPGSGLVQSPAFMAFLPGLVQTYPRRRIEIAVRGYLVVRPGNRAQICPGKSGQAFRETGFPR